MKDRQEQNAKRPLLQRVAALAGAAAVLVFFIYMMISMVLNS